MTITRNFSVLANGAGSANNLSLGGATLGSNALAVTGTASISGGAYISNLGGANKIINGDMVIDQRNAGATVVPATSAYTVDRWYFQITQASKVTVGQNYGGVTPPAGFSKYLGAKITTAYAFAASDYTVINQPIEGYNFADLNWGTANAKAATLSFWVYSSVTGTFGGSVQAAAGARSYPFTYTISVASTWELKSVTIAGDTSGSYNTTTGVGLYVTLSLGAGSTFMGTAGSWSGSNYLSATGANNITNTLNATFYVTGVKLEVGTIATPFVPDDYVVSFAKCQRYCFAWTSANNAYAQIGRGQFGGGYLTPFLASPVTMRSAPSLTASGNFRTVNYNATLFGNNTPTLNSEVGNQTFPLTVLGNGAEADNTGGWLSANNSTSCKLLFTAEL